MRWGVGSLWWQWRERVLAVVGVILVIVLVAFIALCVHLLATYRLAD